MDVNENFRDEVLIALHAPLCFPANNTDGLIQDEKKIVNEEYLIQKNSSSD